MAISLRLGTLGIKLNLDAKEFHSAIKSVRSTLGGLGKVGAVAIGGVAVGVGYAIKSFADLEQAVTNAAAVTKGDFKQNFEAFKNAAMDAAAGTLFSAKESGQALEYLARAGLDAGQAVAALKPVLQFATAANMDLATAADIATDTMTAFGLNVNQLPALMDQMAYTAASSNTNVRMMGEAFKYVAPAAAAFGQSVADTNAMIGTLASGSIKASMAGTTLAMSMLRLAGGGRQVEKGLKTLKTSIYDTNGNFRSMIDVVADLEEAKNRLSKEDFSIAIKQAFGAESLKAMLTFVQKGSKGMSKYSDEIQKATGKTKEMADLMANTVHGQFKIFKGNVETLAARVGSMLLPVIKAFNGWLNQLVSTIGTNQKAFGNLKDQIADTVESFAALISAFGSVVGFSLKVVGVVLEIVKVLRIAKMGIEGIVKTASQAFMFLADPKHYIKYGFDGFMRELERDDKKLNKIANSIGDDYSKLGKVGEKVEESIKGLAEGVRNSADGVRKMKLETVKTLVSANALAKLLDKEKGTKPKDPKNPKSKGSSQGSALVESFNISKSIADDIRTIFGFAAEDINASFKGLQAKAQKQADEYSEMAEQVARQQLANEKAAGKRAEAAASAARDAIKKRSQKAQTILDTAKNATADIFSTVADAFGMGDGAIGRAAMGLASNLQNATSGLDALSMVGQSWAQAMIGVVMEHEKTQQHLKVLGQAVSDLGIPDVLGGFLGAMEPAIGAIISVTQALKPLGEIFGGSGELQEFISGGFLKGVKVFLGAILKLGEVVGYAAYGIALVGQGITAAIAAVVHKIADMASKIGIYLDTSFVDNLRDSTRDAANNIRATLDTIESAQQSLKDVTLASGQAIYDETKLRAELNEKMKEGLRNAPSGFKVNWERYRATQRGGMGDASVDLATRRQGLTVNGDVTINTQASSGEEIYRELAMLNYRRSGNTMASMQTVVASKQGAYKVWG